MYIRVLIISFILGNVIWGINYLESIANVKVRPELKVVGAWEALLSKHFWDWFIYHYTLVSYIVCVFTIMLFVVFIYYVISEKRN